MTTYYTREHEWLRIEGDIAVVGITAHAAEELGELVFVEVKDAGTTLSQGDSAAVVESVKAASDIYAPVDGEIIESNTALGDDPALISNEPEGKGWIFRMRLSNPAQLDSLLDAEAYAALLA